MDLLSFFALAVTLAVEIALYARGLAVGTSGSRIAVAFPKRSIWHASARSLSALRLPLSCRHAGLGGWGCERVGSCFTGSSLLPRRMQTGISNRPHV